MNNLSNILVNGQACYHWDSRNTICDTLCREINTVHQNNLKIPDNLLEKFFEIIMLSCLKLNSKNILSIIQKIFEYYIPKGLYLGTIIQYPDYDSALIPLELNPSFKSKLPDINLNLIYRLRNHLDLDNKNLVDFYLRNYPLLDNIKLFLDTPNNYLSTKIAEIIQEKNIQNFSPDILQTICKSLPYTIPVYLALKQKNFQVDSVCLATACYSCNFDGLKFFLESERIPITSSHFDQLLTSQEYTKILEYPKRYYYNYNNNRYQFVDGYSPEKLELLIQAGFIPTYRDIIQAAKHKKEIPNLSRFNIKPDSELLKICQENNFYPNYNFEAIDPKLLELQKLCYYGKIGDIRKFLNLNKITPDSRCMENACDSKANLNILDLLIDHGGIITLDCIRKCAAKYSHNCFLLKVIDYYKNPKNNNNIIIPPENIPEIIPEIIPEKIIQLDIQSEKLTKIRNKYKFKSNLPDKFIKIFGIDNPQDNYTGLKKLVVSHIKKNGWINPTNKTLISLPENIREILNLDGENIPYEDLDKLIYLLLNIN